MTAADRSALHDAAEHAAQAVSDCKQLAEQLRAVRTDAEQFARRLSIETAGAERGAAQQKG